jgi:hypothetical protein
MKKYFSLILTNCYRFIDKKIYLTKVYLMYPKYICLNLYVSHNQNNESTVFGFNSNYLYLNAIA